MKKCKDLQEIIKKMVEKETNDIDIVCKNKDLTFFLNIRIIRKIENGEMVNMHYFEDFRKKVENVIYFTALNYEKEEAAVGAIELGTDISTLLSRFQGCEIYLFSKEQDALFKEAEFWDN